MSSVREDGFTTEEYACEWISVYLPDFPDPADTFRIQIWLDETNGSESWQVGAAIIDGFLVCENGKKVVYKPREFMLPSLTADHRLLGHINPSHLKDTQIQPGEYMAQLRLKPGTISVGLLRLKPIILVPIQEKSLSYFATLREVAHEFHLKGLPALSKGLSRYQRPGRIEVELPPSPFIDCPQRPENPKTAFGMSKHWRAYIH